MDKKKKSRLFESFEGDDWQEMAQFEQKREETPASPTQQPAPVTNTIKPSPFLKRSNGPRNIR